MKPLNLTCLRLFLSILCCTLFIYPVFAEDDDDDDDDIPEVTTTGSNSCPQGFVLVPGYGCILDPRASSGGTGATVPQNSTGGINYEDAYPENPRIEERKQVCESKMDEIMQDARDDGIENPRYPTRAYHSCMKGVIMQEFWKDAWCFIVTEYAKEIVAAGGCSAVMEKKKMNKARKAIAVATCTAVVSSATMCD